MSILLTPLRCVRGSDKLAKLDPAEIYQTLGENAVLLCWEKPGDACHRRIVAEWLEAALGIQIPEYGIDRIAFPAYEEIFWAAKRQADTSLGEIESSAEKDRLQLL